MKEITIEQILKAVNGCLTSGELQSTISGISIDSRKVKEGDIFFPIIGDQHDAHVFIPDVVNGGCRTIIASKALEINFEDKNLNIIMVEDTTKALQDLASYYLSLFNIKKIAVTGSTGKTTTKEMLYYIFSEKYNTVRNIGNLNNHIGLPLTIFNIDENTEVGIFEMGMSAFGEIDLLAKIVKPDVAIITNIGSSHIENLGTRENILKAKLEITNYFDKNSILIINEENDLLSKEATSGNYKVITVGSIGKSNFIISNIQDYGEDGISFYLEHEYGIQDFRLYVPGRHNAFNGALAIAAGFYCGISMDEAASGLKKLELTDKRLSIKGKNGMKIIDDTYNASPDSMKSAIDVLLSTKGVRKVAILGDMFELGENSDKFHFEVGKYAGERSIDLLIAIGENARFLADGAITVMEKNNVFYYETKELMIKDISSIIASGDVILVKGSRGMAMELIVKKIMEM